MPPLLLFGRRPLTSIITACVCVLKKTETIGVLNNRAWLAEIPACSWKAMRSSLSSPVLGTLDAARAQTASTPAATGMTMASLRARQKRARVLQQTIDKTGLQLADLDVIAVPAWDVIVNAGKRAWEGLPRGLESL